MEPTESNQTNTRFEGIPYELDQLYSDFIDADTKRYFGRGFEAAATFNALIGLGSLAVFIGALNYRNADVANSEFSPDQNRDEALVMLTTETNEIKESLKNNPDTVSVCQDTILGNREPCDIQETYNLTSTDGVNRYVEDQFKGSDIPSSDLETIISGLGSTTEPRTDQTDRQLFETIDATVTELAENRPDAQPQTTNDITGDLLVGGTALILLAAVTKKITNRLRVKRIKKFNEKLDQYPSSNVETDQLRHTTQLEIDRILTVSSDPDRRLFYPRRLIEVHDIRSLHPLFGMLFPKGGGRREAKKLTKKVQDQIDSDPARADCIKTA